MKSDTWPSAPAIDPDLRRALEPLLLDVPAGRPKDRVTGCRHGREVGHRRAADEPDRRPARETEQVHQPVGDDLLDDGSRRRPEIEPDVLVPDRGEPVGGERRRHRSADHEPEVARPAHRHQPAVDPGREVVDDGPWVGPGHWEGTAEASPQVGDGRPGLDADAPFRQPRPVVDRHLRGVTQEVRRVAITVGVDPLWGGITRSDGHRVATPLGPSCRTKVKEFTQFRMPKPLENGASTGTIPTLLSQPSCPSAKAMGR